MATAPYGNAETPAQRCKRETLAYNTSWKQAWVLAHPGKTIKDAPDPTPPYVCGQNNDPAPTITPSTTTDTPAPTSESAAPSGTTGSDGPNLNPPASRDGNANGVTTGQPTITAPGDSGAGSQPFSFPIPGTNWKITFAAPTQPGVSVTEHRTQAYSQLTIARRDTSSGTRAVFPTSIPTGTHWQDLPGAQLALLNSAGKRLTTLNVSERSSGLRLTHYGNNLVADFPKGWGGTIADILASNLHPAGFCLGPHSDDGSCKWNHLHWDMSHELSVKMQKIAADTKKVVSTHCV